MTSLIHDWIVFLAMLDFVRFQVSLYITYRISFLFKYHNDTFLMTIIPCLDETSIFRVGIRKCLLILGVST